MLKPEVRELVDISQSQAARASRADMMLERARWAAEVFHRYDRELTLKIADAVARMAHEKAGFYADWAVRETGFGVAEHKKIKNEMTSIPFVDGYRERDFVSPRILEKKKIIEIPRPAGVVFGLIPSTNPIATVNFKTLLALLTRNAIILSPHPAARECCIDAARTLAAAAEEAGAPEAAIQIVEEPTIPLIEEFMGSPKVGVILATGGTAMVRAAYSSSSPAIGVGPGNAPVFVDESADIRKAASRIVDSKSFDNSVLCTSESVLLTTGTPLSPNSPGNFPAQAPTSASRKRLLHCVVIYSTSEALTLSLWDVMRHGFARRLAFAHLPRHAFWSRPLMPSALRNRSRAKNFVRCWHIIPPPDAPRRSPSRALFCALPEPDTPPPFMPGTKKPSLPSPRPSKPTALL